MCRHHHFFAHEFQAVGRVGADGGELQAELRHNVPAIADVQRDSVSVVERSGHNLCVVSVDRTLGKFALMSPVLAIIASR